MITLGSRMDSRLLIKERWREHAKQGQEMSDMNLANSEVLRLAIQDTQPYNERVYYQPVPEVDILTGRLSPVRIPKSELYVIGLCPYYTRVAWDGQEKTVSEWMSEGEVPWMPSTQYGIFVSLIESSKTKLVGFVDSKALPKTSHNVLYAIGRAVHDLPFTEGNAFIKELFKKPNPNGEEYIYSSNLVEGCTHVDCTCTAAIFYRDHRYRIRYSDLETDVNNFVAAINSRHGAPAPLPPVRFSVYSRESSGLVCREASGDEQASFEVCEQGSTRRYIMCSIPSYITVEIPEVVQSMVVSYYGSLPIGKLTSEETYAQSQSSYSAKHYDKNRAPLSFLSPYFKGRRVYAPGDANGISQHLFEDVRSTDLHISEMSSGQTYISSLRQQFREFRQYSKPKVLFLGFVATFIQPDEWRILDPGDPVVIHDSSYIGIPHMNEARVIGKNIVAYNIDIPGCVPEHDNIKYTTNLMSLSSLSATTFDEGLFYLMRMKPSLSLSLPSNWQRYWISVGGQLADSPGLMYSHTYDTHIDNLLKGVRSYFYLSGTIQARVLQVSGELSNRYVYETDSYALASSLGDMYRRRGDSYYFMRLYVGSGDKYVYYPGQVAKYRFTDIASVKTEQKDDVLYVSYGGKTMMYPLVKNKLMGDIRRQVEEGVLPSQMVLWL